MAKLCALWVGMLALATSVAAQDVPQLTVGRLATGEGPVIDGRVEDDGMGARAALQRLRPAGAG